MYLLHCLWADAEVAAFTNHGCFLYHFPPKKSFLQTRVYMVAYEASWSGLSLPGFLPRASFLVIRGEKC